MVRCLIIILIAYKLSSDNNMDNDLALVKFDKPFVFNRDGATKGISPVCLPDRNYAEHSRYSKYGIN